MSLGRLIWAGVFLHKYLGSSPSCLLARRPCNPPERKAKGHSHFLNKTHHPDFKCFQIEVCICSRWATQRKTKESALCVLAVLEIRSGRQRMKMFVYGLSQCFRCLFSITGVWCWSRLSPRPFSRDSPEPWRKSEGCPGFLKPLRGDILGRKAHITWPWVSILHTMLPQCQRTQRERERLRERRTHEGGQKKEKSKNAPYDPHMGMP